MQNPVQSLEQKAGIFFASWMKRRKKTFLWPQSISGPPCLALILFSPKPWALALLLPTPAAPSPFSLSSDLAQGHLQLGHLGRDFRADGSPVSPSEAEGQSPMAVRYRNNNQRRFSMEASTCGGPGRAEGTR